MTRSLPVLLILGLAAGCFQRQSRSETLLHDVRHYHEGMRWRRYEDAAAHVPPSSREDFLDERDELDDDLNIAEYEIKRLKINTADDTALVQVKLRWHLDSEGIVHDTVVEQVWERRDGTWYLVEEHRKRGAAMPGLPEEPDESDTPAEGPARSSR